MMKRIKHLIVAISLAFGVSAPIALPAMVSAAGSPQQSACEAVGGTFSGGKCSSSPSNGVDVNKIIGVALNLLSVVAGIAAVIMIIISGLRYITSGGDPQGVSGAKNTLIYAIVGLVIVAMSQFIVLFIVNKVTK